MKAAKRDHRKNRKSYVEGLAEAIVLHHSPHLATNEATPNRQERIVQQMKNLRRRERQKRMFKKIGHTLAPNRTIGITRIDIPDSQAIGPNVGSPSDPKTWKGPWISITNPEEIAAQICISNRNQYNQAVNTPFGSGPLATIIGRNGDTPEAEALLKGSLPTELLSSLMPETVRVLHTLASQTSQVSETKGPTISDEEFISTFRLINEATSSSPSGRHVGHYKAILKNPDMVSFHSTMMSIPFQVGIAPDRWTRVTDIMLEKDEGNPRCHRLRILALFEGDFNQAKRIILARRLSHHVEDHNLVPHMQFGSRPGKNCHSAVLQKVLSHDIVRITKQTAAFMENDAVG